MKERERNSILFPAVGVLVFLLLWELATKVFEVPTWFVPSPSKIITEGWKSRERVWLHTQATLTLTLGGFALSSAAGLGCAVVMHRYPVLRRMAEPFVILSQSVPTIAIAPLLILWLGFGILPKLVLIILVCFFPLLIAALDGFGQADREMIRYMRMIGASRRQIFMKLELPASLPQVFSGLKISATYSVMGAVIAEWLGSEKGVGIYMKMSSASFRADRTFVAIFIIVILSFSLFSLIQWLERRLTPWHRKVKGGQQ